MIKHENSNNKSRGSKSNSAPNSPVSTTRSSMKNTMKPSINSGPKLRPSISSSANNTNGDSKKLVKKKLAFSDDEILNDQRPNKNKSKSVTMNSENDTDYEYANVDNLNNSYTNKQHQSRSSSSSSKDKQHKRSISLTKTSSKSRERDHSFNNLSARGKNGSTNIIYDYKSIYDAFEKPIDDMTKLTTNFSKTNFNLNNNLKNSYTALLPQNGLSGSSQNINANVYKNLNESPNDKYDTNQVYFQTQQMDNFLEKEKIAAANIAAAAALKKEKEKEIYMTMANGNSSSKSLNFNNQHTTIQKPIASIGGGGGGGVSSTTTKVISNFYSITKQHIELLPVIFFKTSFQYSKIKFKYKVCFNL